MTPSAHLERARRQLQAFEGRQAIYFEKPSIYVVRVTEINVGENEISARATYIPTPGCSPPSPPSWPFSSHWSCFTYRGEQWNTSRFVGWQLDFSADALSVVPQRLQSIPFYLDSSLRNLLILDIGRGLESTMDEMLSRLQAERAGKTDPDQQGRTLSRALPKQGREAIYATDKLVVLVRVTNISADEMGLWAQATLIRTDGLLPGPPETDRWRVGGCWPCLTVSDSVWRTACVLPSTLQFDPERIDAILAVARGELSQADAGTFTHWLADYVRSGNEEELAQRLTGLTKWRIARQLTTATPGDAPPTAGKSSGSGDAKTS